MIGVRYARERHLFTAPPGTKRLGVLRSNGDNLGAPFCKLPVIAAQLRHVPPAVRSGEAPVEYQNDIALTPVIGKSYYPAFTILHAEIGGSRGLFSGFRIGSS